MLGFANIDNLDVLMVPTQASERDLTAWLEAWLEADCPSEHVLDGCLDSAALARLRTMLEEGPLRYDDLRAVLDHTVLEQLLELFLSCTLVEYDGLDWLPASYLPSHDAFSPVKVGCYRRAMLSFAPQLLGQPGYDELFEPCRQPLVPRVQVVKIPAGKTARYARLEQALCGYDARERLRWDLLYNSMTRRAA